MRISVVGSGYVGTVISACFASKGHRVICVDKDRTVVASLAQGRSPVYEPGLEGLLKDAVAAGRLSATTDIQEAVRLTDVSILAVGTLSGKKGIVLDAVKDSAAAIGHALSEKKGYHVVAVKSTVTPLTCERILLPLLERTSGKRAGEFGLCMNPEFLRQGRAVDDFLHAERIVIGAFDRRSAGVLQKVYRAFPAPRIVTSLKTAEIVKYVSNAFWSTLISFSNEFAGICERIAGSDVLEALAIFSLDRRINPYINRMKVNPEALTYMVPGCGFGGSCLTKDLEAIISFARKEGYAPLLLEAVRDINIRRPGRMVSAAGKAIGTLRGKKIAVLGLSFKPGTDDVRDSPAFPIVRGLLERGARVSVFDPRAMAGTHAVFKDGVAYADDCEDALRGAHAALLVTAWPEFKKISPQKFRKLLKRPVLIDGRRMYDPEKYGRHLRYIAVGRGA